MFVNKIVVMFHTRVKLVLKEWREQMENLEKMEFLEDKLVEHQSCDYHVISM